MACGASRCVGNHHHTTVEMADAQNSALAIIATRVIGLQCETRKHLPRPLEVETSLGYRTIALDAVICDPHDISVYTLYKHDKIES